ncbi:hypothetical protein TorRG33x02_164360, partial [Trema orientale]
IGFWAINGQTIFENEVGRTVVRKEANIASGHHLLCLSVFLGIIYLLDMIPSSELLDPLQVRKNDVCKCVLHSTKRYHLADGIMVNSFRELEPKSMAGLRRKNK